MTSLSDMRFQTQAEFFKEMGDVYYKERDVINFIERVKDRLKQDDNICGSNVFEAIDELAGDALCTKDEVKG